MRKLWKLWKSWNCRVRFSERGFAGPKVQESRVRSSDIGFAAEDKRSLKRTLRRVHLPYTKHPPEQSFRRVFLIHRATAALIRWFADGARPGAEDAFFEYKADLCQRLILDLADALLGDADDLPDLFERERAVGFLLPVESAANHRRFNIGKLREVARDDRFQFVDAVFLDHAAAPILPIALFHVRLKLDWESHLVAA